MRVEFGWMLAADPPASIRAEFVTERDDVVDYSVVLLAGPEGEQDTVRLYDGSHGVNELHRYTRSGTKQPGEIFNPGTLGDGIREAIASIDSGYEAMIEAWQRT